MGFAEIWILISITIGVVAASWEYYDANCRTTYTIMTWKGWLMEFILYTIFWSVILSVKIILCLADWITRKIYG